MPARAFLDGWTPSPVRTAMYRFDRQAPTITVTLIPAPNAAGWHNGDVRVSYACSDAESGIVSCPPEVTLRADGAGQTTTGVTTDVAGNSATATVTVNLDRTPPLVTLTSPAHGATIAGPSVTLTGTVSDALSGIASVTCNGLAATVQDGIVSCTVPVVPGTDALILEAADVAGNTASSGVRVFVPSTPTAVTVAPQQVALGLGLDREVRLLDQAGSAVAGAAWTVTDGAVLSVAEADGVVRVTGLGLGSATVHAAWNGLAAETTVTVYAMDGVPAGAQLWTLSPIAPGASTTVFYANRMDADGPDLYLLERDQTTAVVRGVRADGTPTGAWPVSANAAMVVADRDGGVVLQTDAALRGLIRVGGGPNVQPWSYTPPSRFVQAIGQAPDGTLYVKETTDDEWSAQSIVGLDGATGRVTFRVSSPGFGHWVRRNGSYLTCTPGALWDPGLVGHPLSGGAVGYDGAVYVLTYGEADTTDTCADTHAFHREIQVMRVTSDGHASTTVLDAADATTTSSGGREQLWRPTTALVPDPRGGVHAEWTVSSYGGGQPSQTVTRHAYAGPDSVSPADGALPYTRVGDKLTAYDQAGNAFDLTTEVMKYPSLGAFKGGLSGGGAAYYNAGSLVQTDEHGVVVETAAIPVDASYWHGVWHAGTTVHGGSLLSGSPEAFPDENGTSQIKKPFVVTIAPWDDVGVPGYPYTPDSLRGDILKAVGGRITLTVAGSREATVGALYGSLSNWYGAFPGSPGWGADIVGVIAHSAYDETVQADGSTTYAARGLEFWDRYFVRLQYPYEMGWVPKPGTDPLPGAATRGTEVRYEAVGYSPKLLFVATCFVGPLFESLWAEPGPGQLMILPADPSATTNLKYASEAWALILKTLMAGGTVRDAIDAVKAFRPPPEGHGNYRRRGGTDAFTLVDRK